jgi:hypothetical protein
MVTKLEQISIPDIEYAGLYYPEIYANLRRVNRINAPEITNEDTRELFIQLEKAFALMAHYNNSLLDVVANDVFLPTAKLPESIKLLLALINYKLLPASAAQADILAELVTTYNSAKTILPAKRRVATKRSPEIPEITFENLTDVSAAKRTDQINHALLMEQNGTGVCYTYSVQPDIIYYTSGVTFTTLNQYIRIIDSDLGNNTEDLRIIELLDETSPGSGVYNQVRVEGGGFISESGLAFVLSDAITEDGGGNLLSDQLAAGTCATAMAGNINDKYYFGMADIIFDRYDITLSTPALNLEGRIEFYDPDENYVNPDSVTVVGGTQLKMEITSLIGSTKATNSVVKVLYLPTGAETNVYSTLDGSTNVITTPTLLGQTSPSTTVTDYYVFCDWRPIEILHDTTDSTFIWEQTGYMDYTLPQSQNDNWQKYSLYDATNNEEIEGYYLRYRIIEKGAATPPIASTITFANANKYVVYTGTQGKSVEDSPLGSSDGSANQEFTLTQTPYIFNSLDLYVDEGGGDIFWTPVSSLLSSKSYDRHYVLDMQSDGTAIVKFGDGTNGKIPPSGVSNISATYRIGCDQDGNVGVETITNNIDGNGVFKSVTNPRSGQFWIEADWNSQEALEKVKELAPARVTTMYRAVSASDCEILAKSFRTLENVRPVARAKAYEEALGPKTIELVVVGPGGSALSTDNKDELEEYFNGGDIYNGVLVVNHELSATNYIPRSIGIQCTVTAFPVITTAKVYETLSALINPTALEIDRVTWTWRFGEEVPLSRIVAEIFNISPGNVFKVDITSPTTDILLAPRELPIFDLTSSNVIIEEP